jgi:ABC-type antimicrobial peptide transport system permease subunit
MILVYSLTTFWGGVILGVCLGLLLAWAILKEINHKKSNNEIY